MSISAFFSSALMGAQSYTVPEEGVLLAKGWYLVRATAKSVDHRVSVIVRNEEDQLIVYNDEASKLVNSRLRKYFYTRGGAFCHEGVGQIHLTRFPSWQVRLRTALRILRLRDEESRSNALKALYGNRASLQSLQNRLNGQRNIFAALDKLASGASRSTPVYEISFKNAAQELCNINDDQAYVIFSNGDVKLHPATSRVIYQQIQHVGDAEVFFCHHFNSDGQCFAKPDYDPIYLSTFDYIGPSVFWRLDVAKKMLSDEKFISTLQQYSTILSYGFGENAPQRIDEFLVQSNRPDCDLSSISGPLLTEHIAPIPGSHRSETRGWSYPELMTPPSVSVIIPTYNGLNYLKACIDSLIENTNYENMEVIVVDNNSDDSATLKYLGELDSRGISVLKYPHPFNYSAINNFAVDKATGEYICLLNNDVEAINPEWLHRLVSWAMLPQVGAAGAKLLYADGKIQHAGVAIGVGNAAGHTHRFLKEEPEHLRYRISLPQIVSAVTAACLVVKREKYLAVGGLDAADLAIAYNDIDLCLKLNEAGYINVYCPDAKLFHYESVSRGDDMAADKIKRYLKELRVFQKRWRSKRVLDRVMSKHLDRHSEQFPRLTTTRRF